MINEYHAYCDAYSLINPAACPFEKAILTQCVSCDLSEKHLLAERETVNCQNLRDWRNCTELKKMLQTAAAFSLKLHKYIGELPHGKQIKIQCGGLYGLQNILNRESKTINGIESQDINPNEPRPLNVKASHILNVVELVRAAITRYGNLDLLPYSEIVRAIIHYSRRKE